MNETTQEHGHEIEDLLRWGRACVVLIALVAFIWAAQSGATPSRALTRPLRMTAERQAVVRTATATATALRARQVTGPRAHATPPVLSLAQWP